MRRDVMHFFMADVKTVYQAYLTAAQNKPFERTCEQRPFYSFQFGLNFSMKYNMNGGSCTLHFIPHQGGTAVNLRFSVAQLAGARYEAYDRDLTNRAIDILRIPAQTLRINVEEFLNQSNWVTPGSTQLPPAPVAPAPAPAPVAPAPAPAPVVPAPAPAPVAPAPAPVTPAQPAAGQKCCTRCGSQLLPGARFCTRCGATVEDHLLCKSCGTPLLPGAKFCTRCGQRQ